MRVCFNGEFFPADTSLLTIQNRSFKWGDGLFETVKVFEGKLLLAPFHFERLFISMQLLQITRHEKFTQEIITENILQLCQHNHCSRCARIRLAVYRQDDNAAACVIEASPLDESFNHWADEGQVLTLYPYARKATDAFANLKSANFLPYILARKFAEENVADDAIVLNQYNRICDTSRANIFLVKGSHIYTPSLHEGCVNGVMRRVVMEELKKLGYRLHHNEITEAQLVEADEVFLTNAIQIIRWVKQYKHKQYGFTQTKQIFEAVRPTIFS